MSRDRDRILEQALKHELSGAGTPPAGACLDAETLGAWSDGGLDPAAAAACEAHVSGCPRCQALVGAAARGSSTVGAPGTAVPSGTIGTFPLWKWWLAPMAAGVTAATLWMVIPERPQPVTEPVLKDAGQARTAAEPAPVTQPSGAPAGQAGQRDNAAAATRADQQQFKFGDERKQVAPKEEMLAAEARERATAADAAVPQAAAAAPQAPARPEIAALQKSARQASAAIEVFTLDPSRRWRLAGDRIERSDDAGKTWALRHEQPNAGLSAGSSPSNAVAWFVGRAGLILLTVDAGTTFTDVSLAEPLDLASVSATDAQSAAVFTVSGRRFRTQDGGRTWRPF